jgi:hypothetical protein
MQSPKRSRAVFAVLAAGVIAGLPALVLGFPPAADDSVAHSVWYAHFSKQLWAGELYPRWLADVNAGLGSPVFYYYAPLPYYASGLLAPLFPSGVSALRPLGVASALAVAASGLAAYVWLRGIAGGRAAAAGALVYVFAPYHLAFDLYMRDALAEVFAFVWLPLVVHFARGVRDGRARAAPPLAASYAALALTHLPTVVIFSPVPVCYALLTAARGGRLRAVSKTLGSLALGAGLAAVYLVPALTTQRFVTMSELQSEPYQSAWVPSVTASVWKHEGKLLWIALTTAALAACAYFAARRARGEGGRPAGEREGAAGGGRRRADERERAKAVAAGTPGARARMADVVVKEEAFWFAVAAISILLMTRASGPVWRLLPVLQRVQFPWRFNVLLCLAACALVARAAHSLPVGGARYLPSGVARADRLIVACACAIFAAWIGLTSICLWQAYGDRAKAREFARGVGVWVAFGRDTPEYKPAWAASNSHEHLEALARGPCGEGERLARACVVAGDAAVSVEGWRPREIVLRTSGAAGATIDVRQFYFPYWAARIDGRPLALGPSAPEGLVRLDVPGGEHRVEIVLRRGGAELAGQITSALSLAVLLVLMIRVSPSLRRNLFVTRARGAC